MNEENVNTQTKSTSAKKKQPLVCELFDYIEIFVFAAAAVLLLFTFSLRLCRVDGDSMFDTLENGQMLLVSDLFYTPENNDIIVFHQSDNEYESLNKPLVKRIIAIEDQYYRIVYTPVEESNGSRYVTMTVYVSDDETIDENDIVEEDFIDYKQLSALSGSKEEVYLHFSQPNEDETEYSIVGKVPKGMLFVMGDNRYNSTDSRLNVGYVDTRCVLGKVIYRLTPMGTVK